MKFSVYIFSERKQGSFRRFICLTYPLNDESSCILRTLKAFFEKGFAENAFNSGKKKIPSALKLEFISNSSLRFSTRLRKR